jgi:hypothetical protein
MKFQKTGIPKKESYLPLLVSCLPGMKGGGQEICVWEKPEGDQSTCMAVRDPKHKNSFSEGKIFPGSDNLESPINLPIPFDHRLHSLVRKLTNLVRFVTKKAGFADEFSAEFSNVLTFLSTEPHF